MQILIRTVHTKINDEAKRYLRKKVLKYEMLVPSSSVVECTFEEKSGPKRDGNKIVHIAMRPPGAKKPFFVKSKALPDFLVAIDAADSRLRRLIDKYHELKKFDSKKHRYYLAKIKELPRGLWHKVRRRRMP
ncbi:MAG TPA: HPF/RaiA family ribosome-associated protein [Patescibacteria group bacterium]|nr:HPF/RaiA family ribosome-associated protein [Patescibacteria group bacterium]